MGTRNAVEILMILSVRRPNNFARGPPPIPDTPISGFASLEKAGGTAAVGLATLFEAPLGFEVKRFAHLWCPRNAGTITSAETGFLGQRRHPTDPGRHRRGPRGPVD